MRINKVSRKEVIKLNKAVHKLIGLNIHTHKNGEIPETRKHLHSFQTKRKLNNQLLNQIFAVESEIKYKKKVHVN